MGAIDASVPDPREGGGSPNEAALAAATEAFSPLMLFRRASGEVVGRAAELETIRQELAAARAGRLAAVTLEGEPGIGKTRLLLAAGEMAADAGFTGVAVTADEELRGPFLVARSILGSPQAVSAAASSEARAALAACLNSMSGRDDPGLASLPSDRRLLRTFDLGAVAFRALAAERPLAVLVDDLQWADDDSLRLIRYVVRSNAAHPIALVFTIRPEELALVTEAVNLIADMERMGIVRRLRVARLTQAETGRLLGQVLGAPVDANAAAVMHAQAEGVPFIVEEMAHAYRDGGMLQQIDGTWRVARNAERLVPSAVRTLISRRAAHLPDATTALLAVAAVLGRHFSLNDLGEVELRVGEGSNADAEALAAALGPAVAAGLLTAHDESSAADYSFQHEQVRDFAMQTLTPARRRAIHAAIVELLLAGDPSPASLPLLAHHAKAAGDAAVCVRFSIEASRNALAANAPEEVLRVVEIALPSAASSQERLELLEARDRALDMLRRPTDRLQGLAEIAALAEASGDRHLELDVRLRRAAALRVAEEEDRAAELAREVRALAADRGDRHAELAACIELGQDLLRTAAGEAYVPAAADVDLDGAEEAYRRAAEIAREVGDDAALATSLREIAIVLTGHTRAWFVEQVMAGAHVPIVQRIAAGESLDDILPELPVAPYVRESSALLTQALELFERIGDRRGAMASVIAMAYLSWGPDVHLGPGAARHIEEIRRLTSRMKAFTNESERAAFEVQMLYGVHVFARAKVIPDLALSRGEEAYRRARESGDAALQFLAAGGTAMANLDVGDPEGAARWLDRAAAVASAHPTPLRARRLEVWRGRARAAQGDAEAMREHLERAVALASERGLASARCEALARLSVEASRLGAARGDDGLLDLAERSAREAAELAASLPGHPPWPAQASSSLAAVARARGRLEEALEHARDAMASLRSGMHEDAELDVLLPTAETLRAAEAPEWPQMRGELQVVLAMVAQRTLDEGVRVRWLRGPIGRALTDLAGPIEAGAAATPEATAEGGATGASASEDDLLQRLIRGKTNREIAEELGVDEDVVARRLAELFARIGASSRAEATAFAFREHAL
jgi:DNA-binding CsgD family transcriptional regulator